MEMHALLEEINGLLAKIKAGTASLGELEAFAAATQQLNERAIILKYKAYEAKVFGSSTSPATDSASVDDHHSATGNLEMQDEETVKTEESVVPSHIGKVVPEPIVEADTEEELSFDLFSMDSEEVGFDQPQQLSEQEDNSLPSATVDQSAIDNSASVEDKAQEEPIAEPFIEEKETEIIDEPAATTAPEIVETPKVDASTSSATPSTSSATSTPIPESAPVSHAPVNEHPVLRRARANDGSLQSRLLSVRLETLKNAFGLNERILIVKELFGGDNELYNSTIDSLDNAGDINAARNKMSTLANQDGWREDSELAIEFVQKVERRYA